jgi:hypothetical protein
MDNINDESLVFSIDQTSGVISSVAGSHFPLVLGTQGLA